MRKEKGITLVALVITIIVMLILVGVVIVVNLDDGPINKANDAKTKTEITEIEKEIFRVKENAIAKNDGEEPDVYDITWDDLQISDELKTKYQDKLTIGSDGKLYASNSISNEEKDLFKDLGITVPWWYIQDGEREQMQFDATENILIVATNIDIDQYYEGMENAYIVTIRLYNGIAEGVSVFANDSLYVFPFINQYEIDNGQEDVIKNGYRWYSRKDDKYITKCPIKITDFSNDEIFCRSYLERVINSFGN